MKIIITGAKGNIASHLIKKLQDEELLLIGRDIDINSVEFLKMALDFKPDVLYHLVRTSTPYSSFKQIKQDIEDNVMGIVNILQAGLKCKIIFTSSIEVYGNRILANEDDLPNPQSPYAINKLISEYYIKNSGMPYVILRMSSVYGIKSGMVHSLKNDKKIYTHINNRKDYIHIDDVVEVLLQARNWENGIYNIGSGNSYTIKELAKILKVNPEYSASSLKPTSITISIKKALKTGWRPKYKL